MKKHPLEGILEKRCSFFLAGIDTLIDFVVLEKMKTERCRGHSYRSSILKKDQRSNPKNLIVPFIKLKGAEKEDSFGLCSFYIRGKQHPKICARNNKKVEA